MGTTLLLADDSITIQKVVGIIFANEDYELVAVDNGLAALEKAREKRPDVMLIDAVMPGKNGYEVCEEVRRDPALKDVPILLLVGAFEPFDEERAARSGADDHITKPFESQSLIDKVREMLEIGRSRLSAPAAPPLEASEAAAPLPGSEAPPTASSANLYDSFRGFVHLGAEPEQKGAVEPAPVEFTFEPVETPAQPEVMAAEPVEIASPPQAEPENVIFLSSVDIVEASPEDDPWGAFGEEVAEGEKIRFGEVLAGPEDTGLSAAADETEPFAVIEEEMPPVEFGAFSPDESAVPPAMSESISLGMEPEETPAAPAWEPAEQEIAVQEPSVTQPLPTEAEELPFAAEESYISVSEACAPDAETSETPAAALFEPLKSQDSEAVVSLTEDQLAAAISAISREVIERIAWEVVPDLAEAIIKEEIRKIKEGMVR